MYCLYSKLYFVLSFRYINFAIHLDIVYKLHIFNLSDLQFRTNRVVRYTKFSIYLPVSYHLIWR